MIQRGLERRKIFIDDFDRKEFTRRLAKGLKQTGHKCYGWVLMPNHFHLLIRSGVRPLSDLMRGLLTGYALYFNRRYKRSGYLYQGRYKSILCQEEAYLLELVRYIHLNPFRAGLLLDSKSLGGYKWSGHAVLMGKIQSSWQETGEILERFGTKKAEAIRRYEEFIAEGKNIGKREDLSGGGLLRSAGGWKGIQQLRKSKEKWYADERILGDGDFVSQALNAAEEHLERKAKLQQEGWDIDTVVQKVCDLLGVDIKDIKRLSKRNKIAQARSLIAYFANQELGISGVDIARYFEITPASISEAITRGRMIAAENEYLIA
ncbi:MAG: transposase [Elusimicrobia bacterium]|nr:transposase [Elusimicrobiota bacterium]